MSSRIGGPPQKKFKRVARVCYDINNEGDAHLVSTTRSPPVLTALLWLLVIVLGGFAVYAAFALSYTKEGQSKKAETLHFTSLVIAASAGSILLVVAIWLTARRAPRRLQESWRKHKQWKNMQPPEYISGFIQKEGTPIREPEIPVRPAPPVYTKPLPRTPAPVPTKRPVQLQKQPERVVYGSIPAGARAPLTRQQQQQYTQFPIPPQKSHGYQPMQQQPQSQYVDLSLK